MKHLRTVFVASAVIASTALTGCTDNPGSKDQAPQASQTKTAKTHKQELNKKLHDALPADIKKAGVIKDVNTGSFPPYAIVGSGNKVTGASADMAEAIGQVLGIKFKHTTIDGLGSVLSGMEAKRYDVDLGPIGDYTDRQGKATFVDWVQEQVVFAVQKGNPANIKGLKTTCGKSIAVQAAGSAEQVIRTQSKKCVKDGKKKIDVQTYKDQPSSILAVRSKRADGFFSSQAPLTYFVKKSHGKLEIAGIGKGNGFPPLFQGAAVPKGSPMADILLKTFTILHDNGTYDRIMSKWGLKNNELEKPGINQGNSV